MADSILVMPWNFWNWTTVTVVYSTEFASGEYQCTVDPDDSEADQRAAVKASVVAQFNAENNTSKTVADVKMY